MVMLQLSEAMADTTMVQCSDHFKIPLTCVHFVADDATHTLASTDTVRLTFNDDEEDIVIHNGWTPTESVTTSILGPCQIIVMDELL